MKHAILVDGQLIYAKKYFVDNKQIIVNFDTNKEMLNEYGFKPVVDEKPEYNQEEEYLHITGYTETQNSITVNYEIKPVAKTREQLKQIDENKCLKMFAETLTDEQALLVPLVFDEFEIGINYEVGKRILFNDILYKVLVSHTSQETWTPDVSPSLFAKVLNETLDGSIPKWEQPDSTNGYMKGDKVMFEGKTYESLIDNNIWSPTANPSGWALVEEEKDEVVEPEEPKEPEIEEPVEPETPIEPEQPVEPEPEEPKEPEQPEVEQIPEWVQPHAGNPYKTGDKVMFEGQVYVSLIDGNVWSPTAYPQGWQLIN